MKRHLSTLVTDLTLITALALPIGLVAQRRSTAHAAKSGPHHYRRVDLGTFGGPASYLNNGSDGILNNHGTSVGWADTATPDPFPDFCFAPDCLVTHAFRSRNGVVTDLGTLPGGVSSLTSWITANGLIVGAAENGETDPLLPGFPQYRGVIWRHGVITDLGTLPEGGYLSFGTSGNDLGQVVGFAFNTVPDPFNLLGPGFFPTQTRAFLWQNGAMQDIGTLGGDDALASFVNDRGEVTGQSYTNSTPNPTTGIPTLNPFLWRNGKMMDLGTLGGTVGNPTALNNRGQVVGQSDLAGDLTAHPFLWTKNRGLLDLGTLGGDTGRPNWINDAGDIAGVADLPGDAPQNHDAVLWTHNGRKTIDLGVLPGDVCSNAYFLNDLGQVVGTSENRDLCSVPTGQHAFLWEGGGPMIDLNTLIPTGSSLQLTFAVAINDRGEIAGFGLPEGCSPEDIEFCGHAYVLIPCNQNDHSCQNRSQGSTVAQSGVGASERFNFSRRELDATTGNQSKAVSNRVQSLRSSWMRLGQTRSPHD